ncbi:MAG TPA: 16S rRNA (guanine(527)-N(7))-methyltransferase RsmG [Dissulfurispiraceae bacterium]|nr:16S rRNA (guanine(527)-N(7))-methyltransferase RsmG [Dissulfurispiraceae bacterium]
MEKNRQILSSGLQEIGIEPADRLIEQFLLYLSELKKWNKVYNLTAITDDREIIVKHFLDSLLFLKALPKSLSTVCDVGSGGGFPGMPIALARPDLLVTLLEPSRKKIAFLRQMRRLLHIENVEVLNYRAEEIVESQFDVVATRATFSVAELLKKARHLVRSGGYLILTKGPKFEEEVGKLPEAVRFEVIAVPLDMGHAVRNLVRIAVHEN